MGPRTRESVVIKPLPAFGHPPRGKLGEGESSRLWKVRCAEEGGEFRMTFLPHPWGGQGGGKLHGPRDI